MADNNVLPKASALTETDFRSTWLVTLARLCRTHGDSRVAMWLGVTERHLRNIKGGTSLPSADKLWNLLAFDQSAHDELDAAYGVKNVAADSVCTSDPMTIDMISVAQEVAVSEAPDSPGGKSITDHELLNKNEARLRRVHRTVGGWLDRLDRMRGAKIVEIRGQVRA